MQQHMIQIFVLGLLVRMHCVVSQTSVSELSDETSVSGLSDKTSVSELSDVTSASGLSDDDKYFNKIDSLFPDMFHRPLDNDAWVGGWYIDISFTCKYLYSKMC